MPLPTHSSLVKRSLAAALDGTGLGALGRWWQRTRAPDAARAVNYHDVPPALAGAFEAQLRFFLERYDVLDRTGLAALLAGTRRATRPGLLLTFDDGLRSHAEVVAPLLERHGVTGWFMVPGGFVDAPTGEQRAYADEHLIDLAGPTAGDDRLAMTWDEVRALGGRHEIACHTWHHTRLGATVASSVVEQEVRYARERLIERTGREIAAFAWVGGEAASYSPAAARAVRDAGFTFAFMTNHDLIRPGQSHFALQRSNVEAWNPMSIVRWQVSGVMDLAYAAKRRRIDRLAGPFGE